MSTRLSAKLIVPIWGRRYVEEFARVALPSYLSPGNLPALLQRVDLEVLMMTTSDSVRFFSREATVKKLEKLCPVKFIEIDDLVVHGMYGVTLTLAYARGVRSVGAEQVNTWFLFMNSDFVLADGSLRTVADQMVKGDANCIMAPSLRANSENLTPRLSAMAKRSEGKLSIQPRDFVRMAFENLHATVFAKTVTQRLVQSQTYNQIYWQVDSNTLLARHYLIFMMAIRPERQMPRVNSYCDYGFVPELVPSGNIHILTDSDDFFMLELQQSQQELELILSGSPDPLRIARALSEWTTREHRAIAEHVIVYHTDDLPAGLDTHRDRLTAFVEDITNNMSREPLSHVNHPYWTSGLFHWQVNRELATPEALGAPPLPPEAKGPLKMFGNQEESDRRGHHQTNIFKRMRQICRLATIASVVKRRRGQMPYVAVWHPKWLDAQLAKLALDDIVAVAPKRVLLACSEGSSLQPEAEYRLATHAVDIEDLVEGKYTPNEPVDAAFIALTLSSILRMGESLSAAESYLKPGGMLYVFVEHPNAEADSSWLEGEIIHYLNDMLPKNWLKYDIDARYVGGTLRRKIGRLDFLCLRRMQSPRLRTLHHFVAATSLWLLLIPVIAIYNRRALSRITQLRPYTTSILISLRSRCTDRQAHDVLAASHVDKDRQTVHAVGRHAGREF